MDFLTKHIQRTVDIADGWTTGTLVIENQQAFLQLDSGAIIPAKGIVEVKNGDHWQRLSQTDILRQTREGWPAYAGMDARMKDQF